MATKRPRDGDCKLEGRRTKGRRDGELKVGGTENLRLKGQRTKGRRDESNHMIFMAR